MGSVSLLVEVVLVNTYIRDAPSFVSTNKYKGVIFSLPKVICMYGGDALLLHGKPPLN